MKKKIFLLISFLLLLLFILRGIPFLVNQYLNKNADRIVSDMITRTSGFGDHEVSFGEVRLDYDFFGTFLELDDIHIEPSEDIDEEKVKFHLHGKKARISGFKWMSFLFSNSISVKKAELTDIEVVSITPPLDEIEIENGNGEGDAEDYDLISVDEIELNRFYLENRDSRTDSLRLKIEDLSVSALDFELSSDYIQDTSKLFKVGDIEGKINSVQLHFDKYRQKILVNGFSFDKDNMILEIDDFELIHKMGKYEYTSQFEDRQDWIEVREASLLVKGLNFDGYLQEGYLEVDTLVAKHPQLIVFLDKRKREDFSKRPPMVHEMLENLNQTIHIESTVLEDAYIKVEEHPDNDSPRPGHVFFDKVDATITNISNFNEKLDGRKEMELQANGRLMGVGPLEVDIKYFLENDVGKFTIKGHMGAIPLSEINTMVEPQAKVSIKSGKVNRIDFDIMANDYEGVGEVIVRYEDLEIEILDKDFQNDQNIFRKIGAFLANKVVIKSYNPKNGNLTKGQVYYRRDQHKSLFNYWWKLLFSGLKSTITGQDEEQQRKSETERHEKMKAGN
ncbi:hypothetical protein [Pararhodonellum marinum]|uniref:hypothetical protein n=1 Tax=Pararhodonellum marinum TaxID=2755358 RepID=UPI001890AEA6|nr:hypothetical protein [Pararhodonellum marinum]